MNPRSIFNDFAKEMQKAKEKHLKTLNI